jgi:hypothetical protein
MLDEPVNAEYELYVCAQLGIQAIRHATAAHWKVRAGTSTITMTELLVQPYRDIDRHRVNKFCALLSTYQEMFETLVLDEAR